MVVAWLASKVVLVEALLPSRGLVVVGLQVVVVLQTWFAYTGLWLSNLVVMLAALGHCNHTHAAMHLQVLPVPCGKYWSQHLKILISGLVPVLPIPCAPTSITSTLTWKKHLRILVSGLVPSCRLHHRRIFSTAPKKCRCSSKE